MIAGADEGELAYDLIIGLVFVFLVASFLLPLLLDFGLLEYVGALLTKFMRPVFKVPGRAAVDCITSWIGDGTLGVMLTCNQYEGGYYNAKEASIIATLFSAVSITFSLVVLEEVGLTHMFGLYYLLICFVGIICAIICPRIWPLNKKPETYLVEGNAMPDTLPEGYKSSAEYGMDLALKRVAAHKGAGEFFGNGLKNCLSMWFGVLPTVMAVGTIALIIADYTPIFEWLGMPFYPLLQLLGVPEAKAAAGTMVVGFTDMFTPAILIAGCEDAMTRFIVAVISITQVLFLDEVGGLIISSKLPVNLGELFVIFLERTIISILIVVPIAHLLF
jgi:nucleoside recognition membrane protein YjiH